MQHKNIMFSIFHLLAATLTKLPKMSSRSLPGSGGKGPKIDPKAAKSFPRWTLDAPKITFGPIQKKEEQPFPAQTALLSRTCRPRRPGRPPEGTNHGFN